MLDALTDAGQLDRRITIQQESVTQGDYGEPVETWSTFATVWAAVLPATGREFGSAQQISAEVTTRFIIRWLENLTATMRISYDAKLYDIYRIHEKGREHGIEIWAVARQP